MDQLIELQKVIDGFDDDADETTLGEARVLGVDVCVRVAEELVVILF